MLKLPQDIAEELINKRRYLHAHPELGFEEITTTKKIKEWLTEQGIPILPLDLATGVVAEIKGGFDGPTIAIRADIDALPIEEETDLAYKSNFVGKMHACGHDFHTASILGSAILLNKNKENLHGNVRFLFQPGEETATGAEWMVTRGAIKNVSAIFGMHNKPDLPVGTIGVKSEGLMASVDKFKITFNGIGGHAGIPHNAIDPIVIASQYIISLQTIIARRISLFHNAVISVTNIHGGNTWNVIPDKVSLEGTVRTFQPEAREKIPPMMKQLAESTAEGLGGTVEFNWENHLPVVQNASEYEQVIRNTIDELGYVVETAEPSSAGEDFAFYQTYIPGFFVWMGVGGTYEWHHPKFTLDEKAIIVASEFFANLAMNILK